MRVDPACNRFRRPWIIHDGQQILKRLLAALAERPKLVVEESENGEKPHLKVVELPVRDAATGQHFFGDGLPRQIICIRRIQNVLQFPVLYEFAEGKPFQLAGRGSGIPHGPHLRLHADPPPMT